MQFLLQLHIADLPVCLYYVLFCLVIIANSFYVSMLLFWQNEYVCHSVQSEHRALRHKLKSCTVPILYCSDLVKSRRMLYRPDVCNFTMPYVHRTVPAYAVVRDPAYTAEVFALTHSPD